jgi:hypothetical protein
MDNDMGMDIGLGLLFGGVGLVITLGIYLLIGFSLGKLFEKAGKPLWAGFVPIYNGVVLLEVIGRPIWWLAFFLLGFIPFIGTLAILLIAIVMYIDLAKSYGKDTVYGVLMVFFGIILLPMLAFNKDTAYVGPAGGGDPNPFSAFSGGSRDTSGPTA